MITVKIPKIFYYPLAAYLNATARKTARKYGVYDISGRSVLDD